MRTPKYGWRDATIRAVAYIMGVLGVLNLPNDVELGVALAAFAAGLIAVSLVGRMRLDIASGRKDPCPCECHR